MKYYQVVPLLRKAKYVGHATYASECDLQTGHIVSVPYGQRRVGGVVMGQDAPPKFATKEIQETDIRAYLHPELVQLATWFSEFYGVSKTESFLNLLPSGVHKKRRPASSISAKKPQQIEELPALTPDQTTLLKKLEADTQPTLLHGVTGSGKTRIYIELIQANLHDGKSSLLLVPEIALSGHILERVQAAIPAPLFHLHSGLSERESHQLWQSILTSTKPVVVVGPRSAVFAPVPSLGAILIDECHDSSYKQETTPAYSALHVAGARAKLTGAKLVLASATPNLTEYYWAEQKKLQLTSLGRRISPSTAHAVSLVSKLDKANFSTNFTLSDELLTSVEASLNNKKLSLLFLNRRGFSPVVLCDSCGWRADCAQCGGSLNYHATSSRYQCHICGYTQAPHMNCPQCHSADIVYAGVGTQKLESEVKKIFSGANVYRLDKDSSTDPDYNQTEIFQRIAAGKIDVLIGTQMVGKGFDFANLETVGIIDADTMLYLPDYRSNEVTFQTIAQAIGRNDRRGLGGRTIVQTASPDNHAVQSSLQEDYARFYKQELTLRRRANYPPFSYLLKLTARRPTDSASQNALASVKRRAQAAGLRVLGPAPALHHSSHKRIWHLILQSNSRRELLHFSSGLRDADLVINFDPLHLM